MNPLIRRVSEAFGKYAESVGWHAGEFRVFVRPNLDWGRIHVVLAAESMPPRQEALPSVRKFLAQELAEDPSLRDAIILNVSTFRQIEEGGLHGLPDGYDDVTPAVASHSPA
jgi:hypothetical protein